MRLFVPSTARMLVPGEGHPEQSGVGDVELVDDAVPEDHVGQRRAAQVHEPSFIPTNSTPLSVAS